LLSRNEELNTRFKFDVERMNRQIERWSSQSTTDSTDPVSQQVHVASCLLVQSMCKNFSTWIYCSCYFLWVFLTLNSVCMFWMQNFSALWSNVQFDSCLKVVNVLQFCVINDICCGFCSFAILILSCYVSDVKSRLNMISKNGAELLMILNEARLFVSTFLSCTTTRSSHFHIKLSHEGNS